MNEEFRRLQSDRTIFAPAAICTLRLLSQLEPKTGGGKQTLVLVDHFAYTVALRVLNLLSFDVKIVPQSIALFTSINYCYGSLSHNRLLITIISCSC